METDVPNLADWLQAGSAIVTTLATLFLLSQVYLAKEQLKSTREQMETESRWNRLNATFTYFTNDTFIVRERTAAEALEALGLDLYSSRDPLPTKIVTELYADSKKYREVRDFLNLLEDYGAAVNVEALDPDCSYRLMSGLIARYCHVFMPFIERKREETQDEDYYRELEIMSLQWTKRYEEEREKNIGEIATLRKGLDALQEKSPAVSQPEELSKDA